MAPIEFPTKCADVDAHHLAEARDVPDPHAAAVGEVDDLGRPAEPEHVGGEHAVAFGQRADGVLPPDPGIGAELAAVQQHHRITLSRFQITGEQTVDQHAVLIDHADTFDVCAKARTWVASRSSWFPTAVP